MTIVTGTVTQASAAGEMPQSLRSLRSLRLVRHLTGYQARAPSEAKPASSAASENHRLQRPAQEVQDEQHGDAVQERVDLPGLAHRQLDDDVRDDARTDPVR